MSKVVHDGKPAFGAWLRATWLGWLLGVPCIALFALAAEAVQLGGWQVFVGAGMGASVGFLQARVLRHLGIPALRWFASCAIGLSMPFLTWDILRALGFNWNYSLFVCLAFGGIIVGDWQAILLRRHLARAAWWVFASLLGWMTAASLVHFADLLIKGHAIRGLPGAGLYLALVTFPGGMLGLMTGIVLVTKWRPAEV